MSKFILKDGKWIPVDTAAIGQTPISKGITIGKPPAGIIKFNSFKDRLRRFDKPSDSELRQIVQEEDKLVKDNKGKFEDVFHQAKKDLESGKLRISNSIFNNYSKTIKPFATITDKRGIDHIVPQEVADQYVAKENVSVELSAPTSGPLPPGERLVTEQNIIDKGIRMALDGTNKKRTTG